MPRLDLYVNYELQASIKLDEPEVCIGRGSECAVQLHDDRVSRVHAVISPRGEGHELQDRSVNGLLVNGEAVEGVRALEPGDAIFIQRFVLIYQPDDAPSASNDAAGTLQMQTAVLTATRRSKDPR